MARSSILLKNQTPLVVGNVLGGNNLLIFGTINVTIHLTNLPGTSILDVTPNHNLSTSKFDCPLGEPWVQTGLRVVDNIIQSTPPGAVRRLTWAWLLTVGPASCRLEQLSCAVCSAWVCHGRRQSLGSACESSPPAVYTH